MKTALCYCRIIIAQALEKTPFRSEAFYQIEAGLHTRKLFFRKRGGLLARGTGVGAMRIAK
jgi:hypothetical protein